MFVYLTIILVLAIWYLMQLWKIRWQMVASRQFKNGYISLPFIGHSYLFWGSGEDRMNGLIKVLNEALKNDSNIASMWIGLNYYTVIADPETIDYLSKECLEKPEILTLLGRFLTGNGTIFAPVNIWRCRRKLILPSFSQKNLNGFVSVFSQGSIRTANKLRAKCDGNDFSIWSYFVTYSMDAICETTFGMKGRSKENNLKFLKAFEEYCNVACDLAFKPWCYIIDAVFKRTHYYKILTKNKIIMSTIVNEVISYKRNIIKQNKDTIECDKYSDSKSEKEFSILDNLLEDHGDTITDLELLEEILVLALGGTDTSSVTACFTALLLARHPDIQEKVYQEVKEVLGDTTRPIHYDDLPKLKYLDAVLKESVRLYPPAPIIGRLADKDVNLPSGKIIPKGTTMIFNILGLHRNPKFWGEDVELFNPDRFLNDLPHPAAYIPFSYGPRNCIGYKYGMLSLKSLLATMVSRYEFLPSPVSETFRLEFKVMLKEYNNFQIRLRQR